MRRESPVGISQERHISSLHILFMTSKKSSLPLELQQQILCDLPVQALKSIRLAFKAFSRGAEEYLFRDLTLYPSVQSFKKLDHISTHARFSTYVKGVCYSGNTLLEDKWVERPLTFDTWRLSIGDGLKFSVKLADSIRDTYTKKELEQHYSAYAAYAQSQIALRTEGKESTWLKSIFQRLINLDCLEFEAEIWFDPKVETLNNMDEIKNLSSFAQTTLMERNYSSYSPSASDRIVTLLEAANAANVKVKTFKASHVPWETFEDLNAPGMAKHLTWLQLKYSEYDGLRAPDTRMGFSRFFRNATNLTVLDLNLGGNNERWSLDAEALGAIKSLKLLKLRFMRCRESRLRAILSSHAETLQSLELGWIYLLSDDTASEQRPSWVSMIMYLQSAMKLTNVCLDGILGNGQNENWTTHSVKQCEEEDDPQSHHTETSLRARVERYILNGGRCPFPCPESSESHWIDWTDWETNNKGDHSWHFCYSDLSEFAAY